MNNSNFINTKEKYYKNKTYKLVKEGIKITKSLNNIYIEKKEYVRFLKKSNESEEWGNVESFRVFFGKLEDFMKCEFLKNLNLNISETEFAALFMTYLQNSSAIYYFGFDTNYHDLYLEIDEIFKKRKKYNKFICKVVI